VPYLIIYDELFDEVFQCEVSEETAVKARAAGKAVNNIPEPGIPIQSQYRSDRHPDWAE
jgi:hypothetical protein